jgi:hypothetical protein
MSGFMYPVGTRYKCLVMVMITFLNIPSFISHMVQI